jgi:PAS domain S-box-containing protein
MKPGPGGAPENIVPFRSALDGESNGNGTTLTPVERTAFRELSSRLTARLQGADQLATGRAPSNDDERISAGIPVADLGAAAAVRAPEPAPEKNPLDPERPLLDRLPVGVLIYRHSQFIYANSSFLSWTGHKTLSDFSEAGGLDTLFIETHEQGGGESGSGQSLRIANPAEEQTPVDARLFTIPYDGTTAMALVLVPAPDHAEAFAAARAAETELAEIKGVLDIAADGVVIIDGAGTVLQANNRAGAIFGAEASALAGKTFFRSVRARQRAQRARLFRLAGAAGRTEIAERRPRRGRQAAAGRTHFIAHDDGTHRRTGAEILRAHSRHHLMEEIAGGAYQRQAGGGEGLEREIRISRQSEPRNPHAAERDYRFLGSDDERALRAGGERPL